MKGQKLGRVTTFKYLVAVYSDEGSKTVVLSRIAQVTAALTKLKAIGRDNNIPLGCNWCPILSYPYFCTLVINGP